MSLLEDLNPAQREAVLATEGPVLVLAGAGSGKTRVITYRIAYLLGERGIAPENILALTFTNKAAETMRERVARLLAPDRAARLWISTFHSLCARLLRREIECLGYRRHFTIYDEDDQLTAMRQVLKQLGLDERSFSPRMALERISRAKNLSRRPGELGGAGGFDFQEKLEAVYERYQRFLRQANALDFDDLLAKTVELFAQHPNICDRYNQRFRYIQVDEYQDTNRLQYDLIRQLTRRERNLCVVGDEDQSIYAWRGADIGNILRFEEDFPGTRVIRLEQNYRSTKVILDAAGAVVAHNVARKGKRLWTDRPPRPEDRVYYYEAPDAENESLFVADVIARRVAENPEATFAVLYRTNACSRLFEEALRRYGVPYHVVGGFSFYERAEVKDLMAYLKLILNLGDDVSLLRVINTPVRGIGRSTVDALEACARQGALSLWDAIPPLVDKGEIRQAPALRNFRELMVALAQGIGRKSLAALLEEIAERTGYARSLEAQGTEEAQARIENIRELIHAALDSQDRGETIGDFLDHAALVSEADDYDERARVSLMTLHSAKGLEFDTVFVVGLEEGLFPHIRSLGTDADIEEERRLCYVGMTRARGELWLTSARARRAFAAGLSEITEPSRFLAEIPVELIEVFGETAPRQRVAYEGTTYNSAEHIAEFFRQRGISLKSIPKSRGERRRADEFGPGSRVRHPKFGEGTVLQVEGEGESRKITVSFPNYGRKKLVEKYAGLVKVS